MCYAIYIGGIVYVYKAVDPNRTGFNPSLDGVSPLRTGQAGLSLSQIEW